VFCLDSAFVEKSMKKKMKIRNYSKVADVIEFPNLIRTQTKSYSAFLQEEVLPHKRKDRELLGTPYIL